MVETFLEFKKFDINDDNFIRIWRLLWYKDDEFLIPHNITIEQKGNIYVSDCRNIHFKDIY
jgi:hypothetical protein